MRSDAPIFHLTEPSWDLRERSYHYPHFTDEDSKECPPF